MRHLFILLASLLTCLSAQAQGPAGLRPDQLALVINDDEPNSVEIGAYYSKARGIPAQNIVHVRIPGKPRKLSEAQFIELKQQIDAGLGAHIQAVSMVWTAPYAVECNSITAAFSLGFDASLCSAACTPGKPSPYFNSAARQPFSQGGVRLSMLMPTDSVEQSKALIDRGVLSSFRMPSSASAFYLTTSEAPRNSRARFFPKAGVLPAKKLTIRRLDADSIENEKDIIVYQTGMARVAKLDTLQFVPGALADSLTSFGGDLLGGGNGSQMSSLHWLEAGATASYGTVTEPCNFWQKFPQPSVLLLHYLAGATAIEAYWKSVAWPGQGVFIGEALAAPYRK